MRARRLVIGITCASLAVLSQINTTQAQSSAGVSLYATAQTSAASFWTPERYANATPMEKALTVAPSGGMAPAASGEPEFRNGREGSGTENNMDLFNPADFPEALVGEDEGGVEPNNRGTFGRDYTSTRVIPKNAEKKYPWRATGRLFFNTPSGQSWCSASVIGARIVVTAGHCVHSGNGQASGWYSNWQFIPAYRNGNAPYLTWSWSVVTTTVTWFNGGGGVPNAADYAMILVPDQFYKTKIQRIGAVTGWYGWQTLSLAANHVTMLGYPGNFDSGNIMHQVTAGGGFDPQNNNYEYGSDARGGSSGGPWVQNFSELANGQQGIGLNPGLLRVVAVTSYGYISTDPKVQGASVPDARWSNIFNGYCGTPSNCS
jgi:V8-like Glu-specific endopeptidase